MNLASCLRAYEHWNLGQVWCFNLINCDGFLVCFRIKNLVMLLNHPSYEFEYLAKLEITICGARSSNMIPFLAEYLRVRVLLNLVVQYCLA